MTTHDALLAAVLAAPDDDLPRLVYADHLEGELGQPERAEFIRVQVELAKLHQQPCSVASGAWIGPLRSGRGHVAEWPNSPPGRCAMPLNELGGGLCRKCEAIPRLQWREQELIHADAPRPSGLKWSAWESWLGFNRVRCPDGMNWFRRGFVSEVRCTLAEWYSGVQCSCGFGLQQTYDCRRCGGVGRFDAIGPAVVRSHPVQTVRLSDVVARSGVPGSPFGAVTRQSCGPLWPLMFGPDVGGRVEGDADRLDRIVSDAAIRLVKSQPTHAVYHGDGQAYGIAPTGA